MQTAPLRQTLRYVSRFGWKAGLEAGRLRDPGAPSSLVSVHLPTLQQPLWARPGTSDAATFDEVFVAGEYDIPWPEFRPRRILDLGANIGYASVYFASRWPAARILAVEPDADNIRVLRQNCGAWPGVEILNAAVWSHRAQLRIENPGAASNSFQVGEAAWEQQATVPGYTVEQLIGHMGEDRVDLVKMDIEGAEAEIFRGDTDWLDRIDVLVVELHDRLAAGCSQSLYRALAGRPFRQEIVGQNLAIDLRWRV